MPIIPPRPSGPPLNALRAFEAAARLGGFKMAASELNVTAGAVAQHVKYLEEWCGEQLFERHAKGVRLTGTGAAVLPEFIAAFDALSRATQSLRSKTRPKQVNIAASPSIAQLWLAPRLPEIRAALPGVSISVTAMEEPPNLTREPYDLAIFFEETARQDVDYQFAADLLLPVCTPALAQGLAEPGDMAQVPCLFDLSWPQDWALWLEHLPPNARFTPKGPEFSLYSLAVQEALGGAGILMGHLSLVQRYLDRGELVAPFAGRVGAARYLTVTRRSNMAGEMAENVVNLLTR